MFTKLTNQGTLLIFAAGSTVGHAAITDITVGVNNLAIGQVVYNEGGIPYVQTAETTGVTNVGNTPVLLSAIKLVSGPNLTFFNTGVAKVFNVNPALGSTSGVGVYDNGVSTASNAGLQNFADAVAGTSMDTDLRNYGYHDFVSPGPTSPTVADLDLHFSRALNQEDFLLVSERWGNSSFQLLALAADGQPYLASNMVRLGGPGGASDYATHDWVTGYAATGNQPTQAQALTLFSVTKFFEGSQATAGPIYGFRIFNYDEADVKILGISDNTFLNNPENLMVVPEPTALVLSVAGSLVFLGRRKRR